MEYKYNNTPEEDEPANKKLKTGMDVDLQMPKRGICAPFFEDWIGKSEKEVTLKHVFSKFVCSAHEKQELLKEHYMIDDSHTYKADEIKSWKLNLEEGVITFFSDTNPSYNQKFRMEILGTLTPTCWLRADELHPAKLNFHTIHMSRKLYKWANTRANLVIKELLNRRIEINPSISAEEQGGPGMNSAVYFGHMMCSIVSMLFDNETLAYFRCINPLNPMSSTWILLTDDLSRTIPKLPPDNSTAAVISKIERIYNSVFLKYAGMMNHRLAFISYVQQCRMYATEQDYDASSHMYASTVTFSVVDELVSRSGWKCVVVTEQPFARLDNIKENVTMIPQKDVLLIALFDATDLFLGTFAPSFFFHWS
eukprot:TRINITY_DN821_c0_g1_i2.p1 TRINITY_DN821_c0_g1~~TRINITY_DN821_c0_g1_i2.p1  ORF type:complete len:366 (+),score=49.61 TRINITY_DN821_c0_g1_i2:104-1201(+)